MAQKIREWIPVPIRAVLGLILFVAGVEKFVSYSQEVTAFTEYGIPMAELLVPAVGIVELLAAVLITFGIAGRIGALLIVPVMVTAMGTAGVAATNVLVLVGALVLLVEGTGRYSYLSAEELQAQLGSTTQASTTTNE